MCVKWHRTECNISGWWSGAAIEIKFEYVTIIISQERNNSKYTTPAVLIGHLNCFVVRVEMATMSAWNCGLTRSWFLRRDVADKSIIFKSRQTSRRPAPKQCRKINNTTSNRKKSAILFFRWTIRAKKMETRIERDKLDLVITPAFQRKAQVFQAIHWHIVPTLQPIIHVFPTWRWSTWDPFMPNRMSCQFPHIKLFKQDAGKPFVLDWYTSLYCYHMPGRTISHQATSNQAQ